MRSNITFIKGQGASKRVAAGEDFISGMLIYTGSLPSGFTTTNNVKALYSVIDAENAGILADYSDATAATATLQINTKSNGATFQLKVTDPITSFVYDLGTYTVVSGDSTLTNVATKITAMINAGTQTNGGFSATSSTDTVTVIAPKKYGIALNTGTNIALYTTGTGAGTLTQFASGVASLQAVWHYHIQRFFDGNPSGQLWVGFYPVPGSYTFSEITLLQTASGGKLRQVGLLLNNRTYTVGDLMLIDGVIKTYNDAKQKPLSALYAANLQATSDITTVPDLATLTANKVSSIIGQDGGGLGSFLFKTTGKSVTQLGIALGLLSKSAVSEDFGEPAKFNLSNGYEDAIPAFANGQLLTDPLLSDSALDAIDTKRHIFGQTYIGYGGTFFNDNHTAIIQTSDYAYINDNRVIDKATRGIYVALIPYLKSKLLKNADGTLADTTIQFLQGIAIQPLFQMSRDGDLGEVVASDVYIDPTQDVTATNKLIINVYLNENPIARFIEVPISFK